MRSEQIKSPTDLRQSPEFARFMEKINWKVGKEKDFQFYIRHLPILGNFIKIPRPQKPITPKIIDALAKKYHAFAVKVDFSPTKTLQIDLNQPEEKIFAQFKKDCRYAIRRAKKNKLRAVKVPLEDFYKTWKKNKGRHWIPPFTWIKALKDSFGENFLQLSTVRYIDISNQTLLGGTILLKHDKVMYYYFAFSSKEGKKLNASYFLVWEAIKKAKKKGCRIFDFEGIYDERFKETKSWRGFTHFKKSFGGKEVEYPESFTKFYIPILKLFSIFNFKF